MNINQNFEKISRYDCALETVEVNWNAQSLLCIGTAFLKLLIHSIRYDFRLPKLLSQLR